LGNSIQRPVARFEDFEVNLDTGEVWKAGRPLKVQDQPFKVLAALLERPGQVVTREELRQLIWPDKNFGDFDHAINMALAKLRATLGDSADVPHLIETLPRRGYRFIAPLKYQGSSKVSAWKSQIPASRINKGESSGARPNQ
jgi:DNA-binding winged helix-turn-helix (wHTH) protein